LACWFIYLCYNDSLRMAPVPKHAVVDICHKWCITECKDHANIIRLAFKSTASIKNTQCKIIRYVLATDDVIHTKCVASRHIKICDR
jgi:hypothetical protein